MNALVVFYSRTGTTKNVAEAIASSLDCDIEEIIDTKNRLGFLGVLSAGWSAIFRKLTVIEEITKNPGEYDIVIVGGPVWAGRAGSAARTYLSQYKDRFRQVAFFCAGGGPGQQGVFTDMAELCGKEPVAFLEVTAKEVGKGEHSVKIGEFVSQISTQTQTEK
jgi:flavodoxin